MSSDSPFQASESQFYVSSSRVVDPGNQFLATEIRFSRLLGVACSPNMWILGHYDPIFCLWGVGVGGARMYFKFGAIRCVAYL